ncbi:MAG: transglycosylase SLT domain-containing protein [Dehalococcoidales bacterium]|nr:transglycosylase SLT domain-containing protein [Dehalococcoidales bacterium]
MAWIIQKESGGNPTAQNKKSSAYGLMQFLDNTWGNYGHQKTSDPVQQIAAGIDYIKKRYGTPQNAVAFHQKNGWY